MSAPHDAFTTVDEGEIERHRNIKDLWWDPHGCTVTLHSLNHRRVPYIRDGLVSKDEILKSSKPLVNKKILEVGCGGGILSEALAKIGAQVTGIDPCQELIDLATEHTSVFPLVADNRPKYYCTTIEDHAQSHRNYYDAVIASEVLDHVVNKDLFLKLCIETLKPGGKIFITAPNRTLTARIGVFFSENVFGCAAKGIHDYGKFISPVDVTKILEKNNCEVNNICGLIYYPYIEVWQWVFFESMWYAIQATKID